jgi:hypothetical protein
LTGITVLLCFALGVGFLAHIAWGWQLAPNTGDTMDFEQTNFVRYGRALSMGAFILAGTLSLLCERHPFPVWMIACFIGTELWCLGHAAMAFRQGFTIGELFLPKGPLTWLSLIGVFPGAHPGRFRLLLRAFTGLALGGAVAALVSIGDSPSAGRMEALWHLLAPTQVLLVTAPFCVLAASGAPARRQALTILPFVVLVLVSVLTVTRSFVLVSVAWCILLPFAPRLIRRQAAEPGSASSIPFWVVFGGGLLVLCLFLGSGYLSESVSSLTDRMAEDTRSAQWVSFADQGMLSSLLLGKGPRGVWFWKDQDYLYVEGGWPTMAFTGGIPLVLGYACLITLPAVRCLKRSSNGAMLGVTATLIFWAIAQSGLAVFLSPSSTVIHLIIVLMAGCCIGHREWEKWQANVLPGLSPSPVHLSNEGLDEGFRPWAPALMSDRSVR